MPESEENIKYIYDETGILIGVEIYPCGVSSQNVNDTSNGLRMTYCSGTSVASKNRYAEDVVVGGNLTFSYNHTEQIAMINRKVHQYEPGIDLDYKRADGKTNYEAMLKGKSPIILIQTSDGLKETRLDLHHATQQEVIGFPESSFSQGTLIELPVALHQKYTKVIHIRFPRKQGINRSFRVDKLSNHKYKLSKDEAQFNEFRKQYWKARAQMLKEVSNKK